MTRGRVLGGWVVPTILAGQLPTALGEPIERWSQERTWQWWSTFFGNDQDAPFRERPGLLPVEFGADAEPRP